jgi:bifunctional DNA-binding transcriptional regulator/antitoxin component of YhaV-PrlF toxin-antitoxin module
MKIADSIWLATALLHRENAEASDFSVQEIIDKASSARLVDRYRPGLPVHASKHCVANKPPNPGRYRILVETTRGRRRLFKTGDSFHPDRQAGKIRPDRADLPVEYQALVDWYDQTYSNQADASSSSHAASISVPHQFPPKTETHDTNSLSLDEMRSETAFVGARGTVVLPQFLQQELNLKEGSCLSIYRDKDRLVLLPITEDFIRSLRGSLENYPLQEDREREHRIEKKR